MAKDNLKKSHNQRANARPVKGEKDGVDSEPEVNVMAQGFAAFPSVLGLDKAETKAFNKILQNIIKGHKPILSGPGFKLLEMRKDKKLVFTFEKAPAPHVQQKLDDAGFAPEPDRKQWTQSLSKANSEAARRLVVELSGAGEGSSRGRSSS